MNNYILFSLENEILKHNIGAYRLKPRMETSRRSKRFQKGVKINVKRVGHFYCRPTKLVTGGAFTMRAS